MEDLKPVIESIAREPFLLVASDFDGTLAPIVAEPSLAETHRESLVALKALASMPQTAMAVISGRALWDLSKHMSDADSAHLVGSHGSEFEAGFATPLPPPAQELLVSLKTELHRIAGQGKGFIVEEKPAAVAFHYRNANESDAAAALEMIYGDIAKWPGVYIRSGKKVVELSVVETNKGKALQRLRQRLGATAVLYVGDDQTDEDAFAVLSGPDAGVKVGPGATAAKYRVGDTLEVAQLLASLAERRSDWLRGAQATPIEAHALLSDQRTFALVDPRGRIVWMCLPRLDSSAIFSEILGGPTAGYFEVCPESGCANARQSYAGDSMTVRTAWDGLQLIDYLDCSGGRAFQRAGRTDLIRVVQGRGRVRITFAPRLDFGRLETRLRIAEGGVQIEGALDPCVLVSPGVTWRLCDEGRHQTATAAIDLDGGSVVLEMRYGTANLVPSTTPEPARREQTERFWKVWAATLSLPPLRRDLVLRSALVLRALTYGPTGAIAAAATTSLPEQSGGVRNWDYRFCWPRDASMAAASLVRLGATGPAMKLLDWILGILEQYEPAAMIRPVYTVSGRHLGTEGEIAELSGYRGSRPVRFGNAAALQVQLDVFGPIAELLALLAERGAALSSEHWRLVEAMVTTTSARWREADHGIWEVRGKRQHHVHSKVMCWQTVDRALRVADYLGMRRPDWVDLRKTIADDILANGWNTSQNAFCSTYDDHQADAATLWIGLSGLLAPDDPRFISTIQKVERDLRDGPALWRYRFDDGLPGMEGGFLICTTWLIEAYALVGRRDDAEKLFDEYVALAGPTGLLPEEYDTATRQSLGNYPQAYSHLGLINAAMRLSQKR